jgi:hypothetical protein
MMGDGRTQVVFLWEARAMSEQNLLVSASSVPAGNVPAGNVPAGNVPAPKQLTMLMSRRRQVE